MRGPLKGLKVVEMAGIGAGPHAAMLLADMGADVVRIDRTAASGLGFEVDPRYDLLLRSRRSVSVDLKQAEGRATVLRLVDQADALIESFRPGVMERLGLGPQECLARNPRLVYGRMTGWGQTGPYAHTAGHDINYIALTGILAGIGPHDAPVPPLNLVGDFGGGALHLAFGMVCALLEAKTSGQGQVVDAAMVEGAASMLTMIYGMLQAGAFRDERASNVLDGGSPFYNAYRTADGGFISIGPIEEKFYRELLDRLGLQDEEVMQPQNDRQLWPAQREIFARTFATKTRQQWCSILEGTDVCFAPVMGMGEAHEHPHMAERQVFQLVEGVRHPAPAPRLSRTPGAIQSPPARPGQHSCDVLRDWGWTDAEVQSLQQAGVVVQT